MSQSSTDLFISEFNWLSLPVWVYKVPRQTEYLFHPERQWRLDIAWPTLMLGVEIHGGFYRGTSGHSSAAGIQRDLEKCNALHLAGWLTLYFPTSILKSKKHRPLFKQTLKQAFEWQRSKLEWNVKVNHGCQDANCSVCRADVCRILGLSAGM